jgi:DHA2 family multidrug resistance protein-like MFS transporter
MLTIALAVGMTVIDGVVANVALPTIARDVGASPAASIWVVNAYQLALVISLLPLSSLGDIVGYRKIYQGGSRFLRLLRSAVRYPIRFSR